MPSSIEAFPLAPDLAAAPRRKVLHVCPYMHPTAGGPPVVVERLATHAAAFGWSASIMTTSHMCEDDGSALMAELGRRLDVDILPIDRPRILGHASGAGAAMDAAVRGADMVHVHTLWHPLNTIARRACERHGKPYVLSPHGMLDPYSMGIRALRKRVYLALVERRNLAEAARVVFTTATERDRAGPKLAALTRHEVVSLGGDQPPAIPRAALAAGFLKRHPGGVDGGRILFLSRLHPKKGLNALIEAMPSLVASTPGAHLFIAGSGEKAYEDRLRRRVEKLGLGASVSFTGLLCAAEKWSAMAAADVFVLPSRQENFGLAVVEAMQAGLPVVVSRGVNIHHQITTADAGVVLDTESDPTALAEAIGGFLDDPQARDRAGRNARELAVAEYDWFDAADQCYRLYDAVLRECESGPGC